MNRTLKTTAAIMLIGISLCFIGCNGTMESGKIDGHSYVDLGLPSGTFWATCNMGISSPELYGAYYAWGETDEKRVFERDNYKYYYGERDTKYGFLTLQPTDDAATTNWGTAWCIPTVEQWQELYDNTSHEWTTFNGKEGLMFIAKNKNKVFFPAAGWREGAGLNFKGDGKVGLYWSSSLKTDPSEDAQIFYIENNNVGSIGVGIGFAFVFSRYCGLPIRPVYAEK